MAHTLRVNATNVSIELPNGQVVQPGQQYMESVEEGKSEKAEHTKTQTGSKAGGSK